MPSPQGQKGVKKATYLASTHSLFLSVYVFVSLSLSLLCLCPPSPPLPCLSRSDLLSFAMTVFQSSVNNDILKPLKV